jgi:glycosyltransferase involved in cell wall biosynthesis
MSEVSVVIPTYNRGEYIGQAIRSVLGQTYQDFEIVVVDDGSTDNTREIVNSFANPKISYIFQKNSGVCTAYNTGVQNSRGRLIAFLDSDDIWLPRKLELEMKALESFPEAGVVYCDVATFGSSDPAIPKTFFERLQWPPPRGNVLDKLAECCFPQTSTLLIKKEAFDQLGLFDLNLPNVQDYDMLFRIATKYEFEVVNLPLVKYRIHPTQISKNLESVYSCHIYFFKKALKIPGIDKNVQKKLYAQLAEYHFRYAKVLIHKRKLFKGLKELIRAVKVNPGRFAVNFFFLIKQTLISRFKHLRRESETMPAPSFPGNFH